MISPSFSLIQHRLTPALKTLDLSASGTEQLMAFSEGQRSRYVNSLPFPHIIIDNLFSNELLDAVLQDIAHPVTAPPISLALGPLAQRFLIDLCSGQFCLFLEQLTGIEGLIPDRPLAGREESHCLEEMSRGDFRKLNAGNNWHRQLKLHRRLKIQIYLNTHWEEDWGGQLELWDSDLQNQFVKVPPVFNKTVIFSTDDNAYHGYPTPLKCPESITQRSLGLSYYSTEPAVSTAVSKVRPHPSQHQSLRQSGYYSTERPVESFMSPANPTNLGANLGRNGQPGRRKTGPQLPEPVKSVKKSIKKSLPKPLLALYKAGKRSLRG